MASLRQKMRQIVNGIFRLFGRRLYTAALLISSLCCVMVYVTANARAVYIRDSEVLTLRYTFQNEPEEILSECGITLMAFDAVDFTGFAGKIGEISITRGYPVYINYDGVTKKVMAAGHTLAEVLSDEGIELGPYDELSHNPGYQLAPDDTISLRRVLMSTETTESTISFTTEYRYSSLIRPGRSRVIVPGQNGMLATTVSQRVVDGVVEEEEMLDEHVVRNATKQVVLVGSQSVAISNLDFGIALDSSGKPTQYQYVLDNQVATGYNAGRGAWGASGMNLSAGYVAVRSDEIPYGTKLYITSEDGSFVYGCAIAADTGIGLVNNQIDVDLYYDTYIESRLNGRRNVQIYVLG